MVARITRKIASRPGNLSFAKANAHIELRNSCTAVMVVATKALFANHLNAGVVVKNFTYPSSVGFSGIQLIGYSKMSPVCWNEALTSQAKGAMKMIDPGTSTR